MKKQNILIKRYLLRPSWWVDLGNTASEQSILRVETSQNTGWQQRQREGVSANCRKLSDGKTDKYQGNYHMVALYFNEILKFLFNLGDYQRSPQRKKYF